MEIGEQIYVQTDQFEGRATIQHIIPGELYPVQIELDEGDECGHRIKRVAYFEIKKQPTIRRENNGDIFKNPDDRYVAKVILPYKNYSLKPNDVVIVGPTAVNDGTHYRYYDVFDLSFRGQMPAHIFEIEEKYDPSKPIVRKNMYIEKKAQPEKKKEHYQTNIFDFLEG